MSWPDQLKNRKEIFRELTDRAGEITPPPLSAKGMNMAKALKNRPSQAQLDKCPTGISGLDEITCAEHVRRFGGESPLPT
jgi:hypothetical protein